MNIMIFDTETTSLDKPFCYNIGYVIYDTDTDQVIMTKDFVCEQVWHNPMLFTTAYYSNKREIYILRMRKREAILKKFGYICQEMIRDIKNYEIECAYAYNSPFDEKVFNFNCDWFKCNNPFDNIKIIDIRGYAHKYICNTDEYKRFCEEHNFFTESGNYSTTAEILFRYLTEDINFEEEHTAMWDSIIETDILRACMQFTDDITEDIKPMRTISRKIRKILTIKTKEDTIKIECESYRVMKSTDTIVVK